MLKSLKTNENLQILLKNIRLDAFWGSQGQLGAPRTLQADFPDPVPTNPSSDLGAIFNKLWTFLGTF